MYTESLISIDKIKSENSIILEEISIATQVDLNPMERNPKSGEIF